MDVIFFLEIMIKKFKKFVSYYEMKNEDDIIKYKHSIKVFKICDVLAERLNFIKEDAYVLKLTGLLHNIGRFEQLTINGNYNNM